MADATQQLTFKLVIDGKEGIATLDVVKGKFIETGEAGTKENELVKQAYAQLTAEAFKYKTVTEDNAQALSKYMSTQSLSVDIIQKSIQLLDGEIKTLAINSDAWKEKVIVAANLRAALGTLMQQQVAVVQVDNEAIKENELIKQTYASLTNEALKYTSVTEANVQALSNYISTQSFSTDIIQKSIQVLDNEIKTLAVNSDAWKQKVIASTNLRAAMGNMIQQQTAMNSSTIQALPGMGQMNMAIMQMGYVMNDAQTFMINFRMGMMGIANNIPMIVQLMQQAKQEAGGQMTMMQMLTKSIMGGGGLIIGINALMLVMNLLPEIFKDTTKEIENQKDEIKKLADEYGNLTQRQIDQKREAVKGELDTLTRQFQTEATKGEKEYKASYGNAGKYTFEPSDEQQKQYQTLLNQLNALDEAAAKVGYRKNLENELNQLLEKRDQIHGKNAKDPQLTALDEWIKKDQALLKQTALDNEDSDKLSKQKFERADKELQAAQDHAIRMAEIEGKTDADILQMKKQNLVERIALYERYNQDVTGLVYALAENELQIQKGLEAPKVEIANETQDILLGDYKSQQEYENELRQNSLDKWYEQEDLKLQAYNNYTELKFQLDEEYNRRKARLEEQQMMATLTQTGQMLGQIAGMFSKQSAAYKVLAIAQTWIETYKAVAALYAPPPVGVGPILAPLMTPFVIGMGVQQTSNIAGQPTEMKGYNQGGVLPPGKMGFFEGEKKEIVAPEEDFISYSRDLVRNAVIDASSYIAVKSNQATSVNEDLQAIKSELTGLQPAITKMVEQGVIAYLDNRQAQKITNTGNALNRKSKI